tara:strand:- start:41 stop:493 length:453 start_codon:yes stop_codon:yes gene_type:complete
MKKLLLLSALLIFTCSSDEGNNDYNDNNNSSELIGTYTQIIGYEDEEISENSFNWPCETDFVEFTVNSYNQSYIEAFDCDPLGLITISAPYQITAIGSNLIEGIISYSDVPNSFFEFNISSGLLRTYTNFQVDEDASPSNWNILNIFQKN